MALGMGRVVFAAMLAAVLSAGAQAQDYPSRPVTVVDLTASDLHSAVAYICVLAARCAAAAACVVAQE